MKTDMPKMGDLIKWEVKETDPNRHSETYGIFLKEQASWHGYSLMHILKPDGKIHNVYLKNWELIGEVW